MSIKWKKIKSVPLGKFVVVWDEEEEDFVNAIFFDTYKGDRYKKWSYPLFEPDDPILKQLNKKPLI